VLPPDEDNSEKNARASRRQALAKEKFRREDAGALEVRTSEPHGFIQSLRDEWDDPPKAFSDWESVHEITSRASVMNNLSGRKSLRRLASNTNDASDPGPAHSFFFDVCVWKKQNVGRDNTSPARDEESPKKTRAGETDRVLPRGSKRIFQRRQ
jgi:hypothetical protein